MARTTSHNPTATGWYSTELGAWRWFCADTQRWSWAVAEWMLPGAKAEFGTRVDTTTVPVEWNEAEVPAWVQALNHF